MVSVQPFELKLSYMQRYDFLKGYTNVHSLLSSEHVPGPNIFS